MKYKKILRLLGMITILSMLLAVIPATPALAVGETLTISPLQARVGDRINYSLGGYGIYTGDNQYYVDLYISDQSAIIGSLIDSNGNVSRYKKFPNAPIDENGTYSGFLTLPATLNEGTVGTVAPLTLTAGTTYYIYASGKYYLPTAISTNIKAIATFTITPSASLDALTPATGAAGTVVSVTGTNFPASTPIVFQFDGAAITPTSGDAVTRANGIIISSITIPASATAGAHTITVTAGSSTATATFTVIASATLNNLIPASGASGIDVTVSGANFAISYPIIFKFDTTTIALKSGDTNTSTSGSFNSIITIPASATVGAHTISVTVGAAIVSKPFSVTSAATTTPPTTTPPTTTPPPSKTSLNVVQNALSIGAPMGIGGAGFVVGANVTIKYESKVVASAKVAIDGTFQVIFNIPPAPHGVHQFAISDGVNNATANFTVESVAPKAPPPLKPELGAKVKSPMIFGWTAVTDDSMPVSYNLQISTDKTFAAGTLVLDKTGLNNSSYTLTELEELKLTSATPYYWRVKSVDAASNESEWTGAAPFSIAAPFKIPTWGIYVGAIVGALVIFFIGVFVGRRTAFMY